MWPIEPEAACFRVFDAGEDHEHVVVQVQKALRQPDPCENMLLL